MEKKQTKHINNFFNNRIETIKKKWNLKSFKTIVIVVGIWFVAEIAITLIIGKSLWDFIGK
ncbi:MAG: hypothetical protein KAI81_08905 [Candidatus Marinimicrobia bacterium]|nr:hypothetical protein [Candidatus Neomarinimicrobiota bacterium]